jgi:hypothetical protein
MMPSPPVGACFPSRREGTEVRSRHSACLTSIAERVISSCSIPYIVREKDGVVSRYRRTIAHIECIDLFNESLGNRRSGNAEPLTIEARRRVGAPLRTYYNDDPLMAYRQQAE